MSDNEVIEAFKKYLCTEKDASDNTLSSYLRDIRQLSDYLSINNSSLEGATEKNLNDYIEYLRKSGKSVATVSRSIASIKNMYMNLCIKQVLHRNPSIVLVPDKNIQKLPEILTDDEIALLLSQPKCIDAKGYRDKAMLEVLYSTGIRVTELIELEVEDFSKDTGKIRCKSKGKERYIDLRPDGIEVLNNYLALVRPQLVTDNSVKTLFVNVSGEPMSRQGFWKIIKYYANKANIRKDITPHTLRHSFAAHLLKNGTELYVIKELLGHSDISSTHLYSKQLRAVYMAGNPRSDAV